MDWPNYAAVTEQATRMHQLGASVLQALSEHLWDASIYGQLHERDVCYQQICELLGSEGSWAHLSKTSDETAHEASKAAHEQLNALLKQNHELQEATEKSMVDVQEHLAGVHQRKRFEQTYHPVADVSGGFIAESR